MNPRAQPSHGGAGAEPGRGSAPSRGPAAGTGRGERGEREADGRAAPPAGIAQKKRSRKAAGAAGQSLNGWDGARRGAGRATCVCRRAAAGAGFRAALQTRPCRPRAGRLSALTEPAGEPASRAGVGPAGCAGLRSRRRCGPFPRAAEGRAALTWWRVLRGSPPARPRGGHRRDPWLPPHGNGPGEEQAAPSGSEARSRVRSFRKSARGSCFVRTASHFLPL